jgi:hypothetical protein
MLKLAGIEPHHRVLEPSWRRSPRLHRAEFCNAAFQNNFVWNAVILKRGAQSRKLGSKVQNLQRHRLTERSEFERMNSKRFKSVSKVHAK